MEVVVKMIMMVMMVVVTMVVLTSATASVLMSTFNMSQCHVDVRTPLVSVTKLNVSTPLRIPGQLTVHQLDAHITGPIPDDALVKFQLKSDSSFGDLKRTIPCFAEQGGSCAYNACELVQLTDEASSVRRSMVEVLRAGGLGDQCPLSPLSLSLRDVTIEIPSMLHTVMDTFINTNNYYLVAQLVLGDGRVAGCVQMALPVVKPCNGWLCAHSIDEETLGK